MTTPGTTRPGRAENTDFQRGQSQGWMLDRGMAGFLPPAPLPDQLPRDLIHKAEVISVDHCLMGIVRKSLHAHWAEDRTASGTGSPALARAARLATQIALGYGQVWMLDDLKGLVADLEGTSAFATLKTALTHFEPVWQDHIRGIACDASDCGISSTIPCQSACPAHIDIPGFMALIGSGDYSGAVNLILRDNPLPHVCGLICPAPCEDACLRNHMDEPINIRPLKAVAARMSREEGNYPKPAPVTPTGKKVAIIGSGPAGLTAGYFLSRRGHGITIFEAEKKAGGMLRYGIPEFRLPRDILDQEIEWIQDAGVEIRTEEPVSHPDPLFDRGYDAVYVAIGTQLARSLPIPGIDLPVVLNGLDFLKAVNRGENPRLSGKVLVLGGGNVAIDVAMTALRQGGSEVRMACLEQAHEMPAADDEIRSAKEEGVIIENGWGPEEIFESPLPNHATDYQIAMKCCTRVFNDEGRFSPEFDPARILTLDVDHVILAIGQAADLTCVMGVDEIDIARGLICVDQKTSATTDPRIFAGGDVVHGPSIAINAVRAGKQAAESIDCFLKGTQMTDPAWSVPRPASQVSALTTDLSVRSHPRQPVLTELAPAERTCSYDCIEQSLSADAAHNEVARCMRCDICIGCGLCEMICSEMGFNALTFTQTDAGRLVFTDFVGPATTCVGCGACDTVCPTDAIQVLRGKTDVSTRFTGTAICTQPLEACTVCGTPHATERFQQGLARRSAAVEGMAEVTGRVCSQCARKKSAAALRAAAHKYRG